jgi:two-component system, OmpR family, alkaline phosphatase synthesis response regulator PhoP
MYVTSIDTSPPAPPPPPLRPRVLVIDDSALIREAARVALEAFGGCEVLVAESGAEGIALAEAERPDAILLDVVMPDMDGIAVAERLGARPATSSCQVIFLTAQDRPEERERFEQLPVVGVIAKPFEIETLADELAMILGWPR